MNSNAGLFVSSREHPCEVENVDKGVKQEYNII